MTRRSLLLIGAIQIAVAGCALDPIETAPYRPPGPPLAAEGPPVIAVAPVRGASADAVALRATLVQSLAARSLLAGPNARLTLHARLESLPPARLAVALEAHGRIIYRDSVEVTHGETEAVDDVIDKRAFRRAAASVRPGWLARFVTVQ